MQSETIREIRVNLLNSPLRDLCDEPLLLQDHIFERNPHQQGQRGHVGDRDRHHKPVRCHTVSLHVPHEPGESLRDHKDGHDESCELQPLIHDELYHLPWEHDPWMLVAALSSEQIISLKTSPLGCWTLHTAYSATWAVLFYCWANEVVTLMFL